MNWQRFLPSYLNWSRFDDRPEPDESVREAVQVLKDRDRAREDARRAQGQRDELGGRLDMVLAERDAARRELGLSNADVYMLREQVEDLRRQLSNREEREPADVEAKRWKRQSEQDRENCRVLQQRLDEAYAEKQLVELELLWATRRNLVDPVGAEKVRAAVAKVTGGVS